MDDFLDTWLLYSFEGAKGAEGGDKPGYTGDDQEPNNSSGVGNSQEEPEAAEVEDDERSEEYNEDEEGDQEDKDGGLDGEPDDRGAEDAGAGVFGEPEDAGVAGTEDNREPELAPVSPEKLYGRRLVEAGSGVWSVSFPNWLAFVNWAEHGECQVGEELRYSRHSEDEYGRTGWYGGPIWPKALELARNGWPEGLKRMKEQVQLLQEFLPPKKLELEPALAMVGPGVLDRGRYNQGHPKPWRVRRPTNQVTDLTGKVVKILYNVGALGYVTADQMFEKGAMVCALIDLLERSNRRVELAIVSLAGAGRLAVRVEVLVKRPQDPLDMDRLAFALAHASTLRRLVFSFREQAPLEYRKAMGIGTSYPSYGSSGDCPEEGAINVHSQALPKGTRWLKEQLGRQGVEWES